MSERTKEQIIQELDAKIPRDVIAKREGGGGRSLSYLEGHYVIDRLNKVLGQGQWAYETDEMRQVFAGEVGGKQNVHYIAKVRLVVHCFHTPSGEPLTFTDYGYGDGSDKYNIGKAHELAVKEAVTDGVKRCAKNLGMSMGLALYSKEQENVEDESTASRSAEDRKPAVAAKGPAPKASETIAKPPVQAQATSSDSGISETPPADREQLNKMIRQMASVYVAKKRVSKTTLIELMDEKYKVRATEKLTDEQAKEFYGVLRGMI